MNIPENMQLNFVESQDIEKVDAVTNASNSGKNFVRLVKAALGNATERKSGSSGGGGISIKNKEAL